jgi:type IX secretion system PorP/SprF family membrane protein
MVRIRSFLLIILLGLAFWKPFTGFAQQMPQYSQYMFNGLQINPGYTGYKQEGYIQTTYRNQWVGFPGAPKTFALTADLSANDGTMGFGGSVVSDVLGPTSTTSILLTYAYRIRTGNNSFLGLGISSGASQYSLDPSGFLPIDEDDLLIPQGRVNLFTPNLNSGLFFHNDRFYAGLSAYNMIGKKALEREDIALGFHDFHFFLTSGMLISMGDNVEFKPSFLVKYINGSPMNYDLNAMFMFFETVWLGTSYRSNTNVLNNNLQQGLSNRNAVAMIVELFINPQFRLGYAYDHNINVLETYRNNSHEISVGYYLFHKRATMKNPRWL